MSDRVIFSEKDIGVTTTLSVNGRLFISPYEHLDALVSKVSQSPQPLDTIFRVLYFFVFVYFRSAKEIIGTA